MCAPALEKEYIMNKRKQLVSVLAGVMAVVMLLTVINNKVSKKWVNYD